MKKNIENSEAPVRTAITFAPVSVRSRKIENGTSGFDERRSAKTKAPKQNHRGGEQADRLARSPAGIGGLDERVDENGKRRSDARTRR